jgi:hypothetical protein
MSPSNASSVCWKCVCPYCGVILSVDRRPRKLYLQLDNTARQNKSKYVFAYLGWLVQTGQALEVIVSFLPVGHTHEDIDQLFSRLSVYLRKHDAHDRPALMRAFENAYTTKEGFPLRASYLDRLTNFSGWVEEYIEHKSFKGISTYHQFRLVKLSVLILLVRIYKVAAAVHISCREYCHEPEDKPGSWHSVGPMESAVPFKNLPNRSVYSFNVYKDDRRTSLSAMRRTV